MSDVPCSHARETELQARLRIVQNALKDRNNCIVLRLDTAVHDDKLNPFGFHFEIDKVKYEENKEKKKRAAVSRWITFAALVHNKFGLRHILLIVMMALYAILGGFMFEAIESGYEKQLVAEAVQEMSVITLNFVDIVVNITLTETDEDVRTATLARLSRGYYKSMLKTEDRYLGSAWHKAEDLELNIQWTVLTAQFYAFTLFSTIGYGSISCNTWAGRYISIIYACIGIPLMLLTIGDLGEVLQRQLCSLLNWTQCKLRCCRASKTEDEDEAEKGKKFDDNVEIDEEVEHEPVLPMWIAVSILLIYLCIVSIALYFGDKAEPQETDFSLAASFYFVFITITTTGFGDVMPNSIQYNPLTSLAFLFGLVLLSIINSTVYSSLYDYFYSVVTGIEGTLESIHADDYEAPGHRLFKNLHSAFSTLALSFPSSTPSLSNIRPSPLPSPLPPRNFLNAPVLVHSRAHSDGSIRSLNVCKLNYGMPDILAGFEYEKPGLRKRAQSEETRTRSVSTSTAGAVSQMRNLSRDAAHPTLGPMGGVGIAAAAANRRKAAAREKRYSTNSNDPRI